MSGSFHMITSVLALTINIVFQILTYRLILKIGLLRSIFLGFFAGLFTLLFIESILIIDSNGKANVVYDGLANVLSYGALGYCYFHFINLGETARRIRLLRELIDAGTGLSEREILQRYNSKVIVDKRLARLINSRQVIMQDGRYYLGDRTVLRMATVITIMKLLVLGKKSEFE